MCVPVCVCLDVNQGRTNNNRWPMHTETCKLKLELKTNLYSAIKSEDSEVLDSGTSQLGSQRSFDEVKTCNLVCTNLLMNPDSTPKTRSESPTNI